MSNPPTEPQASDVETEAEQPEQELWLDIEADRFQLVRLAPLPADRYAGVRPLRFARLGRAERHSEQLSVLQLTLEFPGQRAHKEQNCLQLWLDHREHSARLSPHKGLQLSSPNRGLGRFMLAHAIRWAQQHWGSYRIAEATLNDINADAERNLRNKMLSELGLELEHHPALIFRTSHQASHISQLSGEWNHEKVQLLDLLDAGAMLQQADQSLHEQSMKIDQLQRRIEGYSREDNGLRFTVACLVALALFQAGLLIWITTR